MSFRYRVLIDEGCKTPLVRQLNEAAAYFAKKNLPPPNAGGR